MRLTLYVSPSTSVESIIRDSLIYVHPSPPDLANLGGHKCGNAALDVRPEKQNTIPYDVPPRRGCQNCDIARVTVLPGSRSCRICGLPLSWKLRRHCISANFTKCQAPLGTSSPFPSELLCSLALKTQGPNLDREISSPARMGSGAAARV